jgi:hypothetical protein
MGLVFHNRSAWCRLKKSVAYRGLFTVVQKCDGMLQRRNYLNIIIIIMFSCHGFSFFPGTSPLEPVVNPTTQASSLSL